ncbi:hypothetical protein MP228_010740 [Amoeboaphelidium protococcarum]|nr:hypothetical protein MP228_010740 [Amoeboaphelidium protococcarum]
MFQKNWKKTGQDNAMQTEIFENVMIQLEQLTRKICMFVRQLMTQKDKISIADLRYALDPFLVEHSRVPEAVELYKRLLSVT